jgi:putative ABC transport system permease protein
MNSLVYFFQIAWKNLIRGGQRVFVALLCIAFGVMSVVSMTLLSQSLDRAMVLKPSEQIGADVSLNRQAEDYILPAQVAELEELQKSGGISRFTLIAQNNSLIFRRPDSGEIFFSNSGMGIDPKVYPLAGSLTVAVPGNVGAATLLQETGDLLITSDLARDYALQVGDTVILSDLQVGLPVEGHIRGIASDTPNHQGSKIYYTYATADQLANRQNTLNVAMVNAPDPDTIADRLSGMGWSAFSAANIAENNRQAQELFDILFKGAGLLGLMVGGIGVANTMQVLLRRRQREVAIWKTLGYRDLDLQALFALEAVLLGVSGSLLGAGLGLIISRGLVELFSRTTNLLISWSFSYQPVVAGILVGIATTVIFALWAIVAASRARPLALLRNEPVEVSALPKLKSLGLLVLLGLPFTALTSLVMGSLLKGVGLLVFALLGLLVLGGILGGLTWISTRLLPGRQLPLVRMAQNSLRRRGLGLVFAMIALFAGIVALALGVVVTQSAQTEMAQRSIQLDRENLVVIAPYSAEADVRQAVKDQNVQVLSTGYQTSVLEIRALTEAQGLPIEPVLMGRTQPDGYQLSGADWGSTAGVYTYRGSRLQIGTLVEIAFLDGSSQTLPVIGTYDIEWSPSSLPAQLGLLLPADQSVDLALPGAIIYSLQIPAAHLSRISADLGRALPGATVINLEAYATRYIQTYHNLFVLAVAMAGLALLAGVLLIANSVSLAMLDRRYEIGVLKTIGYSRRHILASLAVEYSLVGLIATLAGIAAVQVFFTILAMANDLAASLFAMSPLQAGWIVLCGLGLTLLAVLGFAFQPTQASPSVVLNERV